MKTSLTFLLLLTIYFFGCSSSKEITNQTSLINVNDIKSNLKVLSSDEFEGREATTRGDRLATLFIESELEKYGVKPFFGDTSYIQKIKLLSTETDTSSNLMISNENREVNFKFAKDFAFLGSPSQDMNNKKVDYEFVGFGITAPEYDYDSYKGIDVNGKYVLVLGGVPQSDDTTYFNAADAGKYGNWRYKITTAKEKGALGTIFIADDRTEKMWPMILQYAARPQFRLPDSNTPGRERTFICVLRQNALNRLLNSNDNEYEKLIDKISNKLEANSVNLSGTLEFSIQQNEEEKYTNNIVGYVPGTDPKLKNEFVAVGAHFDHLGISNGVVFNGADDDGSGTVGLLALAKAFAGANDIKRSILFVFHAAEEKGLFGSEFFTDNDSSILKDITAQINLDMIGRESIDTIYSVGSDKLSSELKSIVEKVNKETVDFVFNYQFDDPNDPERIYYRSDHYNYAKHGIPIVFFTDNMQVDYHKPTDDYDKIDFAKIKKTDELVYGIVKDLANLDHKLAVDKEEK